MTAKKMCTYRFSEATQKRLEELAKLYEINKTMMLEQLIRERHNAKVAK